MKSWTVGDRRLELVRGNIVEQHVDAIVNAANTGLAGGGGVDGAIHRAAGPQLLRACKALPANERGKRCPTGEVRVTEAFELPARYVIHGVGPFYNAAYADKNRGQLQSVYRLALEAATERECRSIAFPSISTGAYRFPVRDAAEIALRTILRFLESEDTSLTLVRMVLFSPKDLETYGQALDRLTGEPTQQG